MPIDPRARALLAALNELCTAEWSLTPGEPFYTYVLTKPLVGRHPFVYERPIRPSHINGEPFRIALQFTDEAAERLGRYLLLKPDGDR